MKSPISIAADLAAALHAATRLLRAELTAAFAACDAALATARKTISPAGQLPVGNEKQPQP